MLNSGELPDILMKMNVTSTDQASIPRRTCSWPCLTTPSTCQPAEQVRPVPHRRAGYDPAGRQDLRGPYILAGDAIRMGSKIWYNSDVLEKLNMEMPTTTDEFYEYLKAGKDLDYNENGQADEIPLTSASIDEIVQVLMGSFGLMNRGSPHQRVRG